MGGGPAAPQTPRIWGALPPKPPARRAELNEYKILNSQANPQVLSKSAQI